MFGQARLRCGEGRRSQRCTCNLVSTLLQPLGLSPQSGSSAELEQESLPKRNAVRARALAGGGCLRSRYAVRARVRKTAGRLPGRCRTRGLRGQAPNSRVRGLLRARDGAPIAGGDGHGPGSIAT